MCRLYCSDDIGTLWPIPRGKSEFTKDVEKIDENKFSFTVSGGNFSEPELWIMTRDRFVEMQLKKIPSKYPLTPGGKALEISVNIESGDMTLDLETDESYKLKIGDTITSDVAVTIIANNFYGVRHALETLSQLIVHDELNHDMKILHYVDIEDSPMFKHRGI